MGGTEARRSGDWSSAEGTVILELKSVDRIHSIFEAQLLSYMRLLGKTVGLLINFNVPVLKAGITRKVL